MKVYLELLLFLVAPVLILLFGILPLSLRGYLLIFIVVAIVVLAAAEKMSFKELGLRMDNIKPGLFPYSIFTLLGLVSLFFLSNLLGKTPLANWWTHSHLQWVFLPISFAQEFAYRAVFQTKLQKALSPSLSILIITLLYAGMHLLWEDPLILIMTFFGGLAWGYLWYKYPNLILIGLSHSILNFLAIYLGFFPWLVTEYFNLK